jgi:hypothetical protein
LSEESVPCCIAYEFSLSIYIFCVCGCDVQNISQLASMNYDLMTKHNNLDPLQSSR